MTNACRIQHASSQHLTLRRCCADSFFCFRPCAVSVLSANCKTPALLVVQQFCEDAAAWLAAHAHNVVVVHCKAGKGRTGIMICCLLLYLHIHAPDLANLPAADVATGSNEAGSDAGVDTADADAGSVSSISSAGSSRGWHPWQTVPAVQLKELRNPVKDVLALYADQRTHDGNGVTIASQRR